MKHLGKLPRADLEWLLPQTQAGSVKVSLFLFLFLSFLAFNNDFFWFQLLLGIYFTSSLRYAELYSKVAPAANKSLTFVIAAVIPGNSSPVVEAPYVAIENLQLFPNSQGFLSKACRSGYQSHTTIGTFYFLFCYISC